MAGPRGTPPSPGHRTSRDLLVGGRTGLVVVHPGPVTRPRVITSDRPQAHVRSRIMLRATRTATLTALRLAVGFLDVPDAVRYSHTARPRRASPSSMIERGAPFAPAPPVRLPEREPPHGGASSGRGPQPGSLLRDRSGGGRWPRLALTTVRLLPGPACRPACTRGSPAPTFRCGASWSGAG